MHTRFASLGLPVAAAILLAAAPVASAQVTFSSVWEKLSNTEVNSPRGMAWDPVSNSMILPESAGSYLVHAYDAATGAKKPNLSIEGLTLSGLGHFAVGASSTGKIFTYNVGNGAAPLNVWENINATPTAVPWGGGFARNMFNVGDRIYSTGNANGGPIFVTEPGGDPVGSQWTLVDTIGGPDSGNPGGKAGVTASADGNLVFGTESVSGGGFDGIHVWAKEAGTWTFKGNIAFPSLDPNPFPATAGSPRSTDVSYDQANNLLFGIDHNTSKVFALDLGDPATVGDETYVGEYQVGTDTTFYASLEVDPANKRLHWMARNADASASFGVLTYALPSSLTGDTNDDGVVDLADLNNVLNNFGATGASPGDDNGDGIVDLTDLNNVLNNFGNTASSPSALSVVPEPACLSLLTLASLATLTRRRRRA